MRRFVGVLVAVGLLVSAAVIIGAPAGAAGGTSCKSGGGTATFTPALPIFTSKTKVKAVLKSSGAVAGCSGTVKSGKITGVSPKSTGSNCTTLSTPTTTATKVTLTVKWNTGATSTIAAQLKQIPNVAVTTQTVSGPVKAGLFKGSKLAGKFTYSLPKGACGKGHPLAKLSYNDVGAVVIK
jgi:hypothetical protein